MNVLEPLRNRRLMRSREQKMLLGVAGGIAEYLDTDPTLVRILLVFGLGLTIGPLAILAYLALALIMPRPTAGSGLLEEPPTRNDTW